MDFPGIISVPREGAYSMHTISVRSQNECFYFHFLLESYNGTSANLKAASTDKVKLIAAVLSFFPSTIQERKRNLFLPLVDLRLISLGVAVSKRQYSLSPLPLFTMNVMLN